MNHQSIYPHNADPRDCAALSHVQVQTLPRASVVMYPLYRLDQFKTSDRKIKNQEHLESGKTLKPNPGNGSGSTGYLVTVACQSEFVKINTTQLLDTKVILCHLILYLFNTNNSYPNPFPLLGDSDDASDNDIISVTIASTSSS